MLEFAKKIAVSAGKKHAQKFKRSHFRVNYKSKFEPVTQQDTQAEAYLKKQIRKKFPTHGIIGEEGTSFKAKNDYTWYLDPLDGTINFIRGFPYFCVSVAVLKNNKPYIGVIYNPVTKELFSAQLNKGAYLNGKKIKVSKISKLSDAYLSTGFRYKRGRGFTAPLKKIKNVLEKSLVIRRTGSAALDLANVARGTFDGFFMTDTKKWDVLAGLMIVKEAGGNFYMKQKKEINDLDVIATNGKIQTQIKKSIGWK